MNYHHNIVKKGLFIFLSLLIFSQLAFPLPENLYSEAMSNALHESAKLLSEHPDADVSLLFPVNIVNDKIHLKMCIPKYFEVLRSCDPSHPVLEFGSKRNREPSRYTETLTLLPLMKQNISSSQYVDSFIKEMETTSECLEILERHHYPYKTYEVTTVIIKYKTGKCEQVLFIYAASGPEDMVAVQYGLSLMRPRDICKRVDKLKEFICTHLMLLELPGERE